MKIPFFALLFTIFFINISNAQLILTEASNRNAIIYTEENKDYADYIEVKNISGVAIDLSNYYLSDDYTNPTKWAFFYQILPSNQRSIIFADDINKYDWYYTYQHTNFKITNDGETIYLANSGGIIDSLVVPMLEMNQSVGKVSDTSTGQVFFNTITPGATNSSVYYNTMAAYPILNFGGGIYSGPISMTITCPLGQDAVYTTNSQTPTINSPVPINPVTISSTTVLKVRCKSATDMIGFTQTETFFINENTTLPIFSISTDSANLWDYNTGIWVDGPNAAQWQGANYFKGWRRSATAEYFANGFKHLGREIAICNEGASSISYPKHSIRLNFNHTTMGNKPVGDQFFLDDKPNLNTFKNVVLRNGGNVYGIPYTNGGGGVLYHDAIVESFAKNLNILYAAYQPVIVYLNGEYWGLYELREKMDDYFYKTNANTKESAVREYNGGWENDQYIQWDNVIDLLYNATNKNTNAYYNKMDSTFDIDNIIDYFGMQIHFFNTDWVTPNYTNNVKMWRDTSWTSDKKYRYSLHDMDYSFCNAYPNDNLMDGVLNSGALTAHTKIFRSLIQNNIFKKNFINRYADLVNYYFHSDSIMQKFSTFNAAVQNEIPRECNKWTTNTVAQWNNKYAVTSTCAAIRNIASRNELDSLLLNKSGQVNTTIDVFPANAGTIKISTITPSPLPWTGIYFKGNEVPCIAIAKPGYVFDHWDTNPPNILANIYSANIDTFLLQNTSLTAIFKPIVATNINSNFQDNFTISPNPACNTVQIYMDDKYENQNMQCEIINMYGAICLSKHLIKHINTIDIASLQIGIYEVRITNPNGQKQNYKLQKL